MAGSLKMNVEVQGLKELQARLKSNTLLAEPWRQAATKIGQAGVRLAGGTVPRGATGQTAAKLAYKVQNKPVPRYVVVKDTARRTSRKYPRGFPYPRLLAFSPRSKYRDWMRRSLVGGMGQIEQVLSQAARDIEARWKKL